MYTMQYYKMFLPILQSQMLDDTTQADKATLANEMVEVDKSDTDVLLEQKPKQVSLNTITSIIDYYIKLWFLIL